MGFADLRLARELRAWRRAGRAARLWWRDDDARTSTRALESLLRVADRHQAPLTLAVIPGPGVVEIARAVTHRPRVHLIQHGFDHINRREGRAAGEFPAEWCREQLSWRLGAGWAHLSGLSQARKVFAPPWNDVHPQLPSALQATGYLGWSAWGEIAPRGSPPRIDAHIDLLRWRDGARFRGAGPFASALRRALRARRRAQLWDAPIGLLTHHLDHDEAAWGFLDRLLYWSRDEPALAWTDLDALLDPDPAASATGAAFGAKGLAAAQAHRP